MPLSKAVFLLKIVHYELAQMLVAQAIHVNFCSHVLLLKIPKKIFLFYPKH
jgi:hypothetical protein